MAPAGTGLIAARTGARAERRYRYAVTPPPDQRDRGQRVGGQRPGGQAVAGRGRRSDRDRDRRAGRSRAPTGRGRRRRPARPGTRRPPPTRSGSCGGAARAAPPPARSPPARSGARRRGASAARRPRTPRRRGRRRRCRCAAGRAPLLVQLPDGSTWSRLAPSRPPGSATGTAARWRRGEARSARHAGVARQSSGTPSGGSRRSTSALPVASITSSRSSAAAIAAPSSVARGAETLAVRSTTTATRCRGAGRARPRRSR